MRRQDQQTPSRTSSRSGPIPQILIVSKDVRPKELAGGTAGIGSASHLGGMLLNAALRTEFELVGYKGAGPAMNDLVGGHIDIMVDV